MGDRVAKIMISVELLKQALHMPEDTDILSVVPGDADGNFGLRDIVVTVRNKDLPAVPSIEDAPWISPLITHKQEEFIWDWNVPNRPMDIFRFGPDFEMTQEMIDDEGPRHD